MGLMTLENFRADLQSALGDKGINNPRLDNWIHFANLDLAGSVNFEDLTVRTTLPTVIAQPYVAVPDNVLIVVLVRDITNDNLLGWLPKAEYYRRSQSTTGPPDNWTRDKDELLLHPVPDAIVDLLVITKGTPTKMAAPGDTTIYPDIWDPAILLLAAHHGLLALGEDQRSAAWLARAITYIQSRMTEDVLHADMAGLGASIPSGLQGLMNRLQGLQQQGG